MDDVCSALIASLARASAQGLQNSDPRAVWQRSTQCALLLFTALHPAGLNRRLERVSGPAIRYIAPVSLPQAMALCSRYLSELVPNSLDRRASKSDLASVAQRGTSAFRRAEMPWHRVPLQQRSGQRCAESRALGACVRRCGYHAAANVPILPQATGRRWTRTTPTSRATATEGSRTPAPPPSPRPASLH